MKVPVVCIFLYFALSGGHLLTSVDLVAHRHSDAYHRVFQLPADQVSGQAVCWTL